MTNPLNTTHEQAPQVGRYVISLADGPEAYLTYKQTDAKTITIDHTFVPPVYRGHGVAAALVNTAVDDARQNNQKIVPLCSYVAAQFRRHKDWTDLLAE